ncbi:hypothetical protein [Chryseobacterium lathyri]|uniref:Uncharacterized protein n=1 Tax=Chryseobacterium lathyri TaxID=395933 RepID=A0A511YFY2_9FLAO|nr:hypothetical protein [Chryseobacterium lathyri]GEN74120.1 hypothetical protein CLA01_41920 [Chryseobacterium lathyri]
MNVTISEETAKGIISRCEKIESWTASVKAEMNAVLGGVGTAQDQQKKSKAISKADKIQELKMKFHK